jgi:hypothetical protein
VTPKVQRLRCEVLPLPIYDFIRWPAILNCDVEEVIVFENVSLLELMINEIRCPYNLIGIQFSTQNDSCLN